MVQLLQSGEVMTKGSDGFKNLKLGKNVYRQLKRRGTPQHVPIRDLKSNPSGKPSKTPKEA
jgi:hypothetical protein